ncbi:hypothetical protein B0T21DRAFT_365675 [Apiosordaria backusii]|uniref:3-beta hydroxysteroid dehydrogenase/isomerase domain-containing protein n=1 Tax=Apiosordaria backusii TaxID=314023 RepID=A0AA40EF60_9PEZI|nr:hypothetical protein B0T21DRAFT_365675 [Apiosordaria backusii]
MPRYIEPQEAISTPPVQLVRTTTHRQLPILNASHHPQTSPITPTKPTTFTMASEKKPSLGSAMVIGGCGFLGHHVVRLLLRDYTTTSISVIDLRCTRNRRPESDGVKYYEADITDADKLISVFSEARPDVVNVDGTAAVIKACQTTGVKALVYTSSASVMSDNKSDLINADERWPTVRGENQTEYYSETKVCDTMVLYHMINIYRQGRTGVQVGNNNNLFDFTYVENVAHGHLLAARALLLTSQSSTIPLDHERVDGEAFLVTNDSPVYFWDFCRAIWAAAGSPLGTDHVRVLPRGVGMVLGFLSECFFAAIGKPPTFNRQRIVYSCMTRYYDISKAKKRLGYKPLISLDEGVRRSVKWTLEQEKVNAEKK